MLGTQAPAERAQNPAASMTDIPQPGPFTQSNNVPLANAPAEPLSMPDFSDPSVGNLMGDFGMGATDDFSWDMISLGLEEPLPSQDIIDDMYVFEAICEIVRLTEIQDPNLLREDSSIITNDPSSAVPGCNGSGTSHAPSSCPAVCDVDSGLLYNTEVLLVTGAFLCEGAQIRRIG